MGGGTRRSGHNPDLRSYRGEPIATMDRATRENIERCRSLEDFDFDLDAAERLWDEAMRLPGAADRVSPGGATEI